MYNLVRKVFGIYPGEGRNVFRFARLAFLWAFGSSIAETLSISIFIEKLGPNSLLTANLITASGMIGVSCLFLYFLKITTPDRIIINVLILASFFYAIVTIFLYSQPQRWFWFSLQICTYIYVAASIASFWTFVDQYHNLQDAKRIYGFYNASYYLGYVFSGSLINLAYERIGVLSLFSIVVIAISYSVFEAKKIARKITPPEDDMVEEIFSGGKKGIITIVKTFTNSPFVLFLVAMSLIIQLLITTTEFTYMQTLAKVFNPAISSSTTIAENSIPQFLGKCRALISFGNIIMGMFFYRRFIRKFGLSNVLLFPPLAFLLLYSEWLIYDTLFIAIMGVIAIEGILFTFEDNNFNLLMNAAPSKLKRALRIINDSFFEPIGMFLSSLFLIALQAGNKWFGLALAIFFTIISLTIRQLYPKSILINLKQNAIHFERKIKDWLLKYGKKEYKKDLLSSLNNSSEEIKLLACEALIAIEDSSSLDTIIECANKLSIKNKINFIMILDQSVFAGHSKIIELIDQWIHSVDSEKLYKWSKLYLAKRGLVHPERVMIHLDSLDLFLRGIAITALKKSSLTLINASLNRTIASKEIDLLLKSNEEDEISMGLDILGEDSSLDAIEKILYFLSHTSISIKRNAAQALAKVANKSMNYYASKIIEELPSCSDNKFRLYSLDALGKINDSTTVKDIILASLFFRPNEKRRTETIINNMGLKTVPPLIALIKDMNIPYSCRILASKILGNLSLVQLQINLMEIISLEIKRSHFYFYYGHIIQKQYPLYDLTLLQNALLTGFQSSVDFIIHLLGTAGSMEDCDLVVDALHSKNPKTHADAIETLERNCDIRLFRQITPLIENLPSEIKLKAFGKFNKKFSLIELLNQLEHSPFLFEKTVAAHLKAKLKMPNWKQSLREQIKSSKWPFHQLAYELLES